MPTGYTHAIEKGISFETFALTCARAFGACINLRDEPGSTLPTVDNIAGDTQYHKESLTTANQRLLKLKKCSQKQLQKKFDTYKQNTIDDAKKSIVEKQTLHTLYTTMLGKVKAWVPPSSEHHEFKDFMIQQIVDSIKWDCNLDYYERVLVETAALTFEDWKQAEFDNAHQSVRYYTDELAKATTRVNGQVTWLQQLIDSLK